MDKPHYEFSVGPVEDGKVRVPVCGKRDTRDAAIWAAAEIATRMDYPCVRVEVTKI